MNNNNEVKIINLIQVIAYSQNGIQPKRVDAGYNGKAVFIYDRDATQEIFHKWVHRELTVEFLKWIENTHTYYPSSMNTTLIINYVSIINYLS